MEQIKIIKLLNKTKPISKRQIYNDILSSSQKVKDIIKKTKINKNKYYRNKKSNYKNSEPVISEPVISEPVISEPVISQPVISQPVISEPVISEPVAPPKSFKKTKCNTQSFFKFEKPYKKTLKKVEISSNRSKKKHNNFNSKLKYLDYKKQKSIRIFSNFEINKFINVLTYYSENENYKNIHKYIKKLNKYQINQILLELKIIYKKSKGPILMLKNILYNYFCCNITIIR